MASPSLTGLDDATFAENTVNGAPQIIDADVTFTDADDDFDGGTLVVSGLLAQDTVSVAIRRKAVWHFFNASLDTLESPFWLTD